MLPDIHRATQKFYIFLIVYLTGCTPWHSLYCEYLFKKYRNQIDKKLILTTNLKSNSIKSVDKDEHACCDNIHDHALGAIKK